MKRLIVDIDKTICTTQNGDYPNSEVKQNVVNKLKEYQQKGFEIVLFTSRNMRTYKNNIGKINLHTLPIIVDWLKRYNVPCDELYVGKPWCGFDGFYIDDKSIRPDEFTDLSYEDIKKIIK